MRRLSIALPLLAACVSPDYAGPPPQVREHQVDTFANQQKDVDVLFLIDNSPSMTSKQRALAAAIPKFLQRIDATGANYQIAVATSDVGSWPAADRPFAGGPAACASFTGDDGRLQRVACSARAGLSPEALAACQSLCPDPRFVPAGEQGFIRKVDGLTNVPRLIDPQTGKDLGPQRAFQCIALVGDSGCGIEGQLEGMKRALDGHLPANTGFPRPGALLSVILITDEDDCSVSLAGRRVNDPALARQCDAPDANAPAECWNADFRCLAASTVCDQPLNTPGVKTGCRERPQSYLEPLQGYATFLAALRPNRNDLLLAGVYTSPALDKGGRLVVVGDRSQELNRAAGADAGCVSASGDGVIGRPQHRLSGLLGRFAGSIEVSVCDTDRYPSALDRIATAIEQRLQVRCISGASPAKGASAGSPVCLVGDAAIGPGAGSPPIAFPVCGAGCCQAWARSGVGNAEDPAIQAACGAEPATCYCAVLPEVGSAADKLCKEEPGRDTILGVWRRDPIPPGTALSVQCLR